MDSWNQPWADRFVGARAPLVQPDELREWIVEEDEHVIAINKPGWLVCHPSKQGPMSSLAGAVKAYCGSEKLHLVSRLDRETSGIVLIAKHKKAASQYQKAVENRRVRKTYLLWVHGHFDQSHTVDQPLARDLESEVYVKQTVRSSHSAQKAVTRFIPLHYDPATDLSLVEAHPVTGRKHQIRAHALWLGFPVYGDKIYGKNDKCYLDFIENGWNPRLEQQLGFPRQALHAHRLEFEGIEFRPVFEASLTEDLVELNRLMGLSGSPPFVG